MKPITMTEAGEYASRANASYLMGPHMHGEALRLMEYLSSAWKEIDALRLLVEKMEASEEHVAESWSDQTTEIERLRARVAELEAETKRTRKEVEDDLTASGLVDRVAAEYHAEACIYQKRVAELEAQVVAFRDARYLLESAVSDAIRDLHPICVKVYEVRVIRAALSAALAARATEEGA